MNKCSKCSADTELFDRGVPICVKCSRRVDRERILSILHQDLRIAREKRDQASAHFNDIMGQIPSGVPYPDNQDRIRRASRDYTRAQEVLTAATVRLNAYLIDGEVPPGLEDRQD